MPPARDFRFLHAADLHLDSPLEGLDRYEGAPVDRIRVATRDAFEGLIALARSERVDLVVLAGDLYDGDWKDYNTGLFLNRQLARLDCPVVLLQGNHDAASVLTRSLRPPSNVHVLASDRPETLVFEEIGAAVHGQSFADRKVTRNLAIDYPDPRPGLVNIGVLHTALDEPEGVHARYAPCKIEELRGRGYDYWALGHVHVRQTRGEDPWIVFPGNLQGRHARETGPKGALVVEVRGGRVQAPVFHALDVLRWAQVEVDAAGAETLDAVLDLIRAELAREIEAAEGRLVAARVTVVGRCGANAALRRDPDALVQEIRNLVPNLDGELWIEKVRVRTRDARGIEDLAARTDELGELVRRLAVGSGDETPAAPEFETLLRSLPVKIRHALEGDATDEIETEARELLLSRLLEAEDGA
ncbi:MAG: DNA repair exonuclease [Planctomycetota bacterium]